MDFTFDVEVEVEVDGEGSDNGRPVIEWTTDAGTAPAPNVETRVLRRAARGAGGVDEVESQIDTLNAQIERLERRLERLTREAENN